MLVIFLMPKPVQKTRTIYLQWPSVFLESAVESARPHVRRVRSERVPPVHPDAATARAGRRLHEGAFCEPLLLRRGGPANRRRCALFAGTVRAPGPDAAGPSDRKHITGSHLS